MSRLALTLALLAAGCCINPVDPPPPFDPCARVGCTDAGAAERDGSLRPPPAELCSTADFGGPCERSCASGLACFRERRASTSVAIDDEGGVATLEAVAFPGGLCSTVCANDFDCGTCARCVPHSLAGRARLRGLVGGSGVCRPRCVDDAECAEGTVCDEATGACLEACASDEQCRFATVDGDGDGIEDTLTYDPESPLVCTAGHCTGDAPPLLDLCAGDFACPEGYACLGPEDRVHAGRCARTGCTDGSCRPGATCAVRPDGSRICAQACEVGADVDGERVGRDGRGAGCDFGFACVWVGDPTGTGACVPGTYSAVEAPNLGDVCESDRECYSPYGRGVCLRARPGERLGTCAVHDCVASGAGNLAPGVTVPEPPVICDTAAGATCFERAEGRDRSLCVRACEDATECLPGWACVALAGGGRACFPDCVEDGDCRAGTSCVAPGGTPCTESDRGCACQ